MTKQTNSTEDNIVVQVEDNIEEQVQKPTRKRAEKKTESPPEQTIEETTKEVEVQPEVDEDPRATMSTDDMVAQLKNDLVFSSVSQSDQEDPQNIIVDSTIDVKHRNDDIVDLKGNRIKINERRNNTSIIMGRGL